MPAARKVDGTIFVKPQVFKLLLNDVKLQRMKSSSLPQRAQLASTTNTEVSHKNELNTFLPPSQNDVKKKKIQRLQKNLLLKLRNP